MTEGEPARIQDIRIVGNKVFSESTLLGLFEQTTSGWLTWYTKTDRYSRQTQRRPGNPGRLLPQSWLPGVRGHLDPGHHLRPTSGTSACHHRQRGPAPHGDWRKLEGDYLGRDEEFKHLIKLKPASPTTARPVCRTTRAFTDYYGGFGYTFARADSRPGNRPAPTRRP